MYFIIVMKLIGVSIDTRTYPKGHFIPSGAPMDGKVSDHNDNLVCYVYKYKK